LYGKHGKAGWSLISGGCWRWHMSGRSRRTCGGLAGSRCRAGCQRHGRRPDLRAGAHATSDGSAVGDCYLDGCS